MHAFAIVALVAALTVAAGCGNSGEGSRTDASVEGAARAEGGKDSASPESGSDSGAEATTTEDGQDATMPEGGDDSGTDATIEAGGDGGNEAGVCTLNATQCSGNGVQTCGSNGQWGSPAACTNQACVGGFCSGTCSPDTTACTSATKMATCNESGQWGAATTCTFACVGTIGVVGRNCGGVCVPNATQCSGNAVATCGSNGQWGSAVACSGTTPFCANGACIATPPSCQTSGAGLTNCGASSETCCASLEVAGGTYYRTYTNSGDGGTGEVDPASVSGFRLDKYEVTVGRFRQFVNAWNGGAGYMPPAGSGKHTYLNGGQGLVNVGGDAGVAYEPGWVASDDSNIAPTNANLACGAGFSTWTASAGSNENLPVDCVNWWESYAFCIWDGGFLPSEAEWEYAAAGGNQQRQYPWGTTAPGTGNQYAIYDCYYPSGTGPGTCTGVANVAPVGTATQGAGVWGQLDLAGEVFEWNLDFYAAYVDPCTDCAYLTAPSKRMGLGGGFGGTLPFLLSSTRNNFPPSDRNGGLGFRCARTP
jgi:formylglycine-generating enzyme